MNYTDDYRDREQRNYVERFVPDKHWAQLLPNAEANARWWLARALDAEAELKKIKGALATLRNV